MISGRAVRCAPLSCQPAPSVVIGLTALLSHQLRLLRENGLNCRFLTTKKSPKPIEKREKGVATRQIPVATGRKAVASRRKGVAGRKMGVAGRRKPVATGWQAVADRRKGVAGRGPAVADWDEGSSLFRRERQVQHLGNLPHEMHLQFRAHLRRHVHASRICCPPAKSPASRRTAPPRALFP